MYWSWTFLPEIRLFRVIIVSLTTPLLVTVITPTGCVWLQFGQQNPDPALHGNYLRAVGDAKRTYLCATLSLRFMHSHSLTHSLTYTLSHNHPHIYSLTHLHTLTQSPSHIFTPSPTHSHTITLTHIHSLTHLHTNFHAKSSHSPVTHL